MARSLAATMNALLLFLIALLALTVQRAAAVPFASLSLPPDLRLVTTGDGTRFCVLSASGRGMSSITAADLVQFVDRQCGSLAINAIDLR